MMKKDVMSELTRPIDAEPKKPARERIKNGIRNWFLRIRQKGDLGNPYFIVTVILAVLTAVLVTSGIVALVNLGFQGGRITELNEEVASLTKDNKELRTEVRRNSNPVLRLMGLENIPIVFESKELRNGWHVRMMIQDGKIINCAFGAVGDESSTCEIDGSYDDIYKAVDLDFSVFRDSLEENLGIGLITRLGGMYYIKVSDLIESGSATLSDKITFERPVIDVLQGFMGLEDGYQYVPILIFSNNDYRKLRQEELVR